MTDMMTPTASPAAGSVQADGAWEFIIFGTDWDRHPSTIQHLARRLPASHRVSWVETVGLRSPSLSWHDWRRCWQKLADFASARRERGKPCHTNLQVLCPVTLPFTFLDLVRRFNRWSVGRRLRRAAITARSGAVLVLTCPHQVDYIGMMQEACSLYFCMDNYALWPGMNVRQIARMERQMLERVDGVIGVSAELVKSAAEHGKPSRVISQGVDLDHFTLPARGKQKAKAEIVYFGLIDSRVDLDLLLKVSRAFPEAVIRLIGPQISEEHRLQQAENIRIEPAVPYASLPAAVSNADVFILPFAVNPLTRSCTPLKLKEYLATGRPVVSTANPAVAEWQEHVRMASSHEEFIAHLQLALQEKTASGALRQQLQNETWDAKAAQFLAFAKHIRSIKAASSSHPPQSPAAWRDA